MNISSNKRRVLVLKSHHCYDMDRDSFSQRAPFLNSLSFVSNISAEITENDFFSFVVSLFFLVAFAKSFLLLASKVDQEI